ncbi:MAG: sigma-70 family RNA polymerase sigma factor [Verrucomicrobia bacterium]|nr:sigma-70 family RNA polymerase sigma factor [Verrucomicrobiota bacterium]
MSPDESERTPSCGRQEWFATTHWSVVLAAGDPASQRAKEALEVLCRAYWRPLYSFIRRLKHSPTDAQDLTQAFLANLLTGKSLNHLSPERGRFRSWLLASLKYFLADEWDKIRAEKRGGRATIISLDAQQAEQGYAIEPKDERDPAVLFERRWALTLLERVLGKLEAEMIRAGSETQWRDLKYYLLDDEDAPAYAELAARLSLSLSGVKMSVSRLRQRFGELLRAEIANTVTDAGEVEEELRYLLTRAYW